MPISADRKPGVRRRPRTDPAGDLRLLHGITVIANEAPSAEWALERAIERICSDGDWQVGHAYLESPPGSGDFRDPGIWWLESPVGMDAFVRKSGAKVFRPGRGLVGRVIASARAERIADVSREPKLARRREMIACGIRSGVVFPIMVDRHVAGVMEFFATKRRRVAAAHLEILAQLGTHLGRIVERKQLEREIAQRAANEQNLIGREIHDTLGQQITAIEMLVKGLARRLEPDSRDSESVRTIVGLVEEAKRQVGALSRGLAPVEVDEGGLMAALEDLATSTSSVHGLECLFDCPEPVAIKDPFAAEQLYRIAREGVHNAVKHGRPSRITVGLRERGGLVRLRVEDDGEGPGQPSSARIHGQGLRIMAYRARSIGATVRLERGASSGAVLTCTCRNRPARAAGHGGRA